MDLDDALRYIISYHWQILIRQVSYLYRQNVNIQTRGKLMCILVPKKLFKEVF